MKIASIGTALVLLLATLTIGCASTPEQEELEQQYMLENSLAETNRAAVDALTVLGFEIEENTDTYVEGHRPHKIGLFVGSGGETVGVWLEAISDKQTKVKIDTAKSFAGYVGQKDWDEEMIAEMRKFLSSGG
jgi:hypothetical protein